VELVAVVCPETKKTVSPPRSLGTNDEPKPQSVSVALFQAEAIYRQRKRNREHTLDPISRRSVLRYH
jgi:hypothetical protein